ncbi:MAG: hypothetical protein AAFX06_26230 [Planctomycetota bacterium]
MRAANEAAELLTSFEEPPAFNLWDNPVVARARSFKSLRPDRFFADTIFQHCNSKELCADGEYICDGGINQHLRLWIVYEYRSLTDFRGESNYTYIHGLISAINRTPNESELFFGFGWQGSDPLSRLNLGIAERKLKRAVLSLKCWRSAWRVNSYKWKVATQTGEPRDSSHQTVSKLL